MDIETAANPAGADDTRVLDTASPTPDAGAQTQAEGAAPENQPAPDDLSDLLPPDDEFEEVEFEGAKYKVPAPLKGALLKEADYRRKTMELAEQRRAVEAASKQIEQTRQMSAAEIRSIARLENLNAQLAGFEGINWAEQNPDDPQVRQAHWTYQQLLGERVTLSGQLNEHFRLKDQLRQQETAKAREESDRTLAKEIKGWSPEKRRDLESFAVSQGIPEEVLGLATAPELKILNLAHIGAQFIERQRAAAKAQAQGAAKPVPEVGGAGAGAGAADLSRMSMDEYVQARKAGKI